MNRIVAGILVFLAVLLAGSFILADDLRTAVTYGAITGACGAILLGLFWTSRNRK